MIICCGFKGINRLNKNASFGWSDNLKYFDTTNYSSIILPPLYYLISHSSVPKTWKGIWQAETTVTQWIDLGDDNKPVGQLLKSRCCSHDDHLIPGHKGFLEHLGSESCQTGPRAEYLCGKRVKELGPFPLMLRESELFSYCSLSLFGKRNCKENP